MGFFSDLFDGTVLEIVKDAIDGAVKWVGEKIADAFGLETKENTQRAIAKAQEEAKEAKKELEEQKARNAKEFADSLGEESYDVETANAREIRLMNEELYKIQESFKQRANSIEQSMIECIQGTVHDMLEQFENINDTTGLNLNIAYMKSMEDSLRNQVTGYIQGRIRRFVSIDNEKCKAILKMKGKLEKEMAMQRFQDEIISNAVNDLLVIVKDIFTEQNTAHFTQIENRFRTIELQAEESIRQFEEIKKTKQQDAKKLKEKQTMYQNMIEITAWCVENMEGDTLT